MKIHSDPVVNGITQQFVFAEPPKGQDGFILWVGFDTDLKRYRFTAADAYDIMTWLNENIPMEYHLPDNREVAEHLAELDEMQLPT